MQSQELIEVELESSSLKRSSNNLFYWGPIGHQFSDCFLTMGNVFLQKYFEGESVKKIKGIFSSFVEMVQNLADYNEGTYSNGFPQSLVSIEVLEQEVVILTSNMLEKKDVADIESRFSNLLSLNGSELIEAHNHAILKGQSLGLFMLKKMEESKLSFEINENQIGEFWLNLKLKIKYGTTKN